MNFIFCQLKKLKKRDGSFDDCKQYCANDSRCKYFFYRPSHEVCILFDSCEETRESSQGITVRKDTIPTNEPSFAPSFSAPTLNPTVSSPTTVPTTSEPSQLPTTTRPSCNPTVSPSGTVQNMNFIFIFLQD